MPPTGASPAKKQCAHRALNLAAKAARGRRPRSATGPKRRVMLRFAPESPLALGKAGRREGRASLSDLRNEMWRVPPDAIVRQESSKAQPVCASPGDADEDAVAWGRGTRQVTSDARAKAMRWNERIRLVIGVFNRSAVAVLGAAAVGSAFRSPGAAPPAGARPLQRHSGHLARLRAGAAPAGPRVGRPDRAGGLMTDLDAAAIGLAGLATITTVVLVALHRLRRPPPAADVDHSASGDPQTRRNGP